MISQSHRLSTWILGLVCLFLSPVAPLSTTIAADAANLNTRKPATESELKFWLENMVWHHGFSTEEITQATGLSSSEIQAACDRLRISAATRPNVSASRRLRVLPYPGGRHPRIGFLDGAIDPQRETKVSIFTPWDDRSYVVCDFPEALWSNLGLTYLAHTHVPTLWNTAGVTLPTQEWKSLPNGQLESERTLPNGIRFGTRVRPAKDHVDFDLWLFNGTSSTLSDLRVQNCVMLKAAAGFNAQTNANKLIHAPYVACRSEDGNRWIISGWEPCHRPWANPPVPCLHADPRFPDCKSGETQRLKGWFSFYEGRDIEAELRRITATGWRR